MLSVLNPMPSILYHYERELVSQFDLLGVSHEFRSSGNIDAGFSRRKRAASQLRSLAEVALSSDPSLVLWPSFGYWDAVLCRASRGPYFVIVHDATPLRAQFGMSARVGRLVGRALEERQNGRIIVHSHRSFRVLREMGWPEARVLAHPMLSPRGADVGMSGRPRCVVFGQYKPSRAVSMLSGLRSRLPDWDLEIVGRGWPTIDGWKIDDRFVPEADVNRLVGSATVILIPYQEFFQSGVMVRAAELAVPVVTVRHEQTEMLYGTDWPGIVDGAVPASVAEAIRAAARMDRAAVLGRVRRAHSRVLEEWHSWASDVGLVGP